MRLVARVMSLLCVYLKLAKIDRVEKGGCSGFGVVIVNLLLT